MKAKLSLLSAINLTQLYSNEKLKRVAHYGINTAFFYNITAMNRIIITIDINYHKLVQLS
jgi:hypothetical protein